MCLVPVRLTNPHASLCLQAAAQEAVWAKQIVSSESKADNAEGMATAMKVSVQQLEDALQQRHQEVAAKEGASVMYRLLHGPLCDARGCHKARRCVDTVSTLACLYMLCLC
jgi:predicted trehalose synthase